MICEMQVMDPSGHLSLTWDPGDAPSVARARAEFDRLKAEGWAFFTTAETPTPVPVFNTRGRPPAWRSEGALDLAPERRGDTRVDSKESRAAERLDAKLSTDSHPVRTRTFQPKAERTVAVRPMRGG